jgi:hypothetical protein
VAIDIIKTFKAEKAFKIQQEQQMKLMEEQMVQ